jgi:hypothetical protein
MVSGKSYVWMPKYQLKILFHDVTGKHNWIRNILHKCVKRNCSAVWDTVFGFILTGLSLSFKNMFIRLFIPVGKDYLLQGSRVRITAHVRDKGSVRLTHSLRDWEISLKFSNYLLIFPQLVKKFLSSYGTHRFITMKKTVSIKTSHLTFIAIFIT